jgi:hypothetical protein
MENATRFTVETLGKANIPSPIKMSNTLGDLRVNYVRDEEAVLYDIYARTGERRKSYRSDELLQLPAHGRCSTSVQVMSTRR